MNINMNTDWQTLKYEKQQTLEQTNTQMDKWMDRRKQTYIHIVHTVSLLTRQMDGQTDGQMDGLWDKWTNRLMMAMVFVCVASPYSGHHPLSVLCIILSLSFSSDWQPFETDVCPAYNIRGMPSQFTACGWSSKNSWIWVRHPSESLHIPSWSVHGAYSLLFDLGSRLLLTKSSLHSAVLLLPLQPPSILLAKIHHRVWGWSQLCRSASSATDKPNQETDTLQC